MLRLRFAGLLLAFAAALPAQNFSAIYQFSDAKIRQETSSGWEGFLEEHRQQNASGYRLTDLETYREGGNPRQYVGIYTQSPLRDSVGKASSWSAFIKLKRKMAAAEYTMIDVAAVVLNETDADYYGVWVKDETPTIHKVWLLNDREMIIKRTRLMAKDRFKIKRVHVLNIPNGEPAFVVLYHFSPINRFNFLYFANSLQEFGKEREARKRSKVELIDFDRFREGDKTQYVAIFQDGEYDSDFLTAKPIGEVNSQATVLDGSRGLKLVNLSVD